MIAVVRIQDQRCQMPASVAKRIEKLLIQLRDGFDGTTLSVNRILADSGLPPERFTQSLGPPESAREVPTLDPMIRKPLSPMLNARFEFCSRWRRFDENWLSVSQMSSVAQNRMFRRHFASKSEHWDNSAPATISKNRLSVFGVSSHAEGDYTFIVWPDKPNVVEPAIWRYEGQSETRFANLEKFLHWLVAS